MALRTISQQLQHLKPLKDQPKAGMLFIIHSFLLSLTSRPFVYRSFYSQLFFSLLPSSFDRNRAAGPRISQQRTAYLESVRYLGGEAEHAHRRPAVVHQGTGSAHRGDGQKECKIIC